MLIPCVFCQASLHGADFLVCGSCRALAHRECWAVSNRCPVEACRCGESLEPAVALAGPRSAVTTPPAAAPRNVSDTKERLAEADRKLRDHQTAVCTPLFASLGLAFASLM